MADSWWARKLAPQQQAPQQRPHVPGYPLAPAQPPYAPPPQQGYVPPGYPQPAYTQQQAGSDKIPALQAVEMWRGSREASAEQMTCPSCGSTHYFSRQNDGGTIINQDGRSVPTTPMCYTCGYTPRFGRVGDAFADAYAAQ